MGEDVLQDRTHVRLVLLSQVDHTFVIVSWEQEDHVSLCKQLQLSLCCCRSGLVSVTLLELCLNLKISFQHIQYHRLHVPTDPTAVPETTQTHSTVILFFVQLMTNLQVNKLTSAQAEQYSGCSWRTPPCLPSSAGLLHDSPEYLRSTTWKKITFGCYNLKITARVSTWCWEGRIHFIL